MNEDAVEYEGDERSTSDVAAIEDIVAEARVMAEELSEMALSRSKDLEEQRHEIKVIADSIELRLDDAELHLGRLLPSYQPVPSICTRNSPIVDTLPGEATERQREDMKLHVPTGPEIEF